MLKLRLEVVQAKMQLIDGFCSVSVGFAHCGEDATANLCLVPPFQLKLTFSAPPRNGRVV